MEEYRQAWNGDLMRAIRGELAEGRFHDYCLESPACPIVRKAVEAHMLPSRQRTMIQLRHGWARFDHLLGGVPTRIWEPLKRGGQMARIAVTDPARVARRARRLFGGDPDCLIRGFLYNRVFERSARGPSSTASARSGPRPSSTRHSSFVLAVAVLHEDRHDFVGLPQEPRRLAR